MSLTGLFQREKPAVYLGLALLTAAGLFSMRSLPAGAYPEAVFPESWCWRRARPSSRATWWSG